MKWVKMTTQRSFTIAGVTIPSCVTDGQNKYAQITDEQYYSMHKNPVFKALEASNGVLVLSKMPTDISESPEALKANGAKLQARITELEEQLKKGGVKDDSTTKKLEKDLKEKSKDLDEAIAMIKDLQAQLAAKGE